jgi:pyruvate,water dikinase
MSNHTSYITELSQTDIDTLVLGNKAANLCRLIYFNYHVPQGFVIKTNAYHDFLSFNNLDVNITDSLRKLDYDTYESIEACSNVIQNSIINSEIPPEIIDELKLNYKGYSANSVAVRSSASAEDLPTASFAGQYNTYLNLNNLHQIIDHIKKCYASVWTTRAISYRFKNQIPHDKVKIAVIVQKMVPAKSAGVLFTLNPLTLKRDEMVIESNFGLGESIVSGRSSPDEFFIQKLKKKSFRILNSRIGNKNLVVQPKPNDSNGGVEYLELSEDLAKQASLSESNIIKLAKIGIDIEKKFKNIPQDIEWVIDQDDQIYLLQTRPITALKSEIKPPEILWSRGYSDDYWNDNVTPLFFELLGDPIRDIVNIELNSIMGYQRMAADLLKHYKAHVYFNLDVIKRKVENEIPKFMRSEDVLNYFPEGSGIYGKKSMKDLPFHIVSRIVAELRIGAYDPNGAMSKTAEAYENWEKGFFTPFYKSFQDQIKKLIIDKNLQGIINLAEKLDKLMISHFRLIRYGIPVHNLGMSLLVQYLLTRFLSKEDCSKYYPVLISGLNNKLTETNSAVYSLASIITESSELKSIFDKQDSSKIYEDLLSNKDEDVINFLKVFREFLKEFGDRGFTREILYPRWKESPMKNIFDVLKSLALDQKEDWEAKKTLNRKKREIMERIVEFKIRKKPFGLLKWKILSIILKNSRKYICFRENQRFNLDRWISMNREIFLEIGNIFVEKGMMADKSKIFFLHKDEIKKLSQDEYNKKEIQAISSKIIERFEYFKKYENTIPPKFLLGNKEFNDALRHNMKSQIYFGLPASHGIKTSVIRVIYDINFISKVRTGEIIVVPQTDPGWTPVFSKIGGLITETGGILSHGAVVSREYGIPAVTNITNACKIFATGQRVTINGFDGTVIPVENERGV